MLWSLANNRIPRAQNLCQAISIYWSSLTFSTTQINLTIMKFCIITAKIPVSILTRFWEKLSSSFWEWNLVRLTRKRHLKANLNLFIPFKFYIISKVDCVPTVLFQTRVKEKMNGHWILSTYSSEIFFWAIRKLLFSFVANYYYFQTMLNISKSAR